MSTTQRPDLYALAPGHTATCALCARPNRRGYLQPATLRLICTDCAVDVILTVWHASEGRFIRAQEQHAPA